MYTLCIYIYMCIRYVYVMYIWSLMTSVLVLFLRYVYTLCIRYVYISYVYIYTCIHIYIYTCIFTSPDKWPYSSRLHTALFAWAACVCVAACYSVLQRVTACCSVLQCVAVYCSVLQCVAMCCSALQYAVVCSRV